MRFLNVITQYNQKHIDNVIRKMSLLEVDEINQFYTNISSVEYTNELGNECMFAILSELSFENLQKIFKKHGIIFELVDLTKQVVFDIQFETRFRNDKGRPVHREILKLIKEFKLNYTSKDDVLDKILEMGIDSLNQIDYKILKS
jgi:hypothetical protein